MAYSGTGALPGTITYVQAGESAAVIQAKLDSVQAGNTLVFESGTYDFAGSTIVGKSGVTVWADGQVAIHNAPGANTGGAFNFSGQADWTIGGKAPGQGFIFHGSLIDASNASGNWSIGNGQFHNQQSNGFDGSAIRMNGASFGTVVNNDFVGAGGNVVGMYNLNHIRIEGNHFIDCYEPISIHGPTNGDPSFGNGIVIAHNVFLGTQRAAIEIGPASLPGTEHFSGLVIHNNYFDNFNNVAGDGTLLAISAVGQSSDNTTITNNYISRGPNDAGDVGVAIEMTGTGEVSGNTIVNFAFAALAYQSGWNFQDNVVHNDGSGPYYGFGNNGSGWGIFGTAVESLAFPSPGMPARIAWGTEFTAEGDGGWIITFPQSTAPALDMTAPDPQFTGATLWDGHVTLTGTSEPGSEVWVHEHQTRIGVAIAADDGTWAMTGDADAGTSHTYGAIAWDAAGNLGESSPYQTTATVLGIVFDLSS